MTGDTLLFLKTDRRHWGPPIKGPIGRGRQVEVISVSIWRHAAPTYGPRSVVFYGPTVCDWNIPEGHLLLKHPEKSGIYPVAVNAERMTKYVT